MASPSGVSANLDFFSFSKALISSLIAFLTAAAISFLLLLFLCSSAANLSSLVFILLSEIICEFLSVK
jgi:hypothetical protein